MSFSGANPPPPPPPHFLPLPFPGRDVDGFLSQFPMNPEHSDSHSQHENVPPFKRSRNFESNPPKSGLLSPMSPMMNPPKLQGGIGTNHIFYKTRMCTKFLVGTCRKGELCTYAHGVEDLREPPPNWQEFVCEKDRGFRNWNDDQRFLQRMKICKWYYNGEECPFGEKCIFLHELPMKFHTDTARQRESCAISISTTGAIMGSGSDNEQPENEHADANSEAFQAMPVFWKSKICSQWEMTGQCPSGERCLFAHCQSELNVPGDAIEAEQVVKSDPIGIKPLSVPVVDSSPASAVAGASNKEDEEDKKISKWKLTKKIKGIYADWIDDFMPPDDLPSEAEG